jgi:hypothetical protein
MGNLVERGEQVFYSGLLDRYPLLKDDVNVFPL